MSSIYETDVDSDDESFFDAVENEDDFLSPNADKSSNEKSERDNDSDDEERNPISFYSPNTSSTTSAVATIDVAGTKKKPEDTVFSVSPVSSIEINTSEVIGEVENDIEEIDHLLIVDEEVNEMTNENSEPINDNKNKEVLNTAPDLINKLEDPIETTTDTDQNRLFSFSQHNENSINENALNTTTTNNNNNINTNRSVSFETGLRKSLPETKYYDEEDDVTTETSSSSSSDSDIPPPIPPKIKLKSFNDPDVELSAEELHRKMTTIRDITTGREYNIDDTEVMNNIHRGFTLFPDSPAAIELARAQADVAKHDKLRTGAGGLYTNNKHGEHRFIKVPKFNFGRFGKKKDGDSGNESVSSDTVSTTATATATATATDDGSIPVHTTRKTMMELSGLQHIQSLAGHSKSIWTMEFSPDGRYLVTAGQDPRVYVWLIQRHTGDSSTSNTTTSASTSTITNNNNNNNNDSNNNNNNDSNNNNNNTDNNSADFKSTPTSTTTPATNNSNLKKVVGGSIVSDGNITMNPTIGESASDAMSMGTGGDHNSEHCVSIESPSLSDHFVALGSIPRHPTIDMNNNIIIDEVEGDEVIGDSGKYVFLSKPYRTYIGHKAHVIDIAWSPSNFLLTASLDATVRLFHVSRDECLGTFKHVDVVTSVSFYPLDERFFISGSFDQRIRLWNLPEAKVVNWVQSKVRITATAFSPDGQFIVAGHFDGTVIFYRTDRLKYFTRIECKNRRGVYREGRKVTGFAFRKLDDGSYELLVTTNDSRQRLISMRDFTTVCKYKGSINVQSQIRAGFSDDGVHIVSGSEDGWVYLWRTNHDLYVPTLNPKFTGFRKDRNSSYECFKASDHGMLTSALIVPRKSMQRVRMAMEGGNGVAGAEGVARLGFIIVTASTDGVIKIYETNDKPLRI